MAQRATGDLGTHVLPGQQCSQVEETWHLRFDSHGCERAGLCCCDVCWVPCGISRVQNSVVSFQRLRISPVCGQESSIVISLCCPKNLTVVLLRSVRFWKMAVCHALGRIESAWRCHTLSPIVPSCFHSNLVLRHKGFALVHPCYDGIQCRCCQSLVSYVPMLYSLLFRAVASGTVDCTFVGSDACLNCGWDLVSLRTETCQEELALPTSRRTSIHVPGQHDNQGLSKILSTTRAVLLQAPRAHAVLH